jgi:hypothetical protein
VRDDPAERGYASHSTAPAAHGTHQHASVWRGLMEVLSYRNTWILVLVPIGVAGPVLTFAGLWGVPYLRQVHGLDTKTAAAITSSLLVAWALGGPILGTLVGAHGPKRKPLYVDHHGASR